MPKLSVIVPMYNIENYIEKCLLSIQNQTFRDYICYVVCDGSKDGSLVIAKKFEADEHFVVLEKENGGLSDARNYGLKYVDSEYVMFIDGDDFLENNCFETCVLQMENKNLDIFIFGYNQYYTETKKKEVIHLGVNDGVYCLKDNKDLLFKTPNAAWNKIYKTSLFKENNIGYPLNSRYEDLGTTAKLLYLAKTIGYQDIPLYNYLIDRPNNISTQIDEKLYHIFDMSKEIIDFYHKEGAFEDYQNELAVLIKRNIISALRKVVTIRDKNFVNSFIDHAFDFEDMYLPKKNIYQIENVKDDKVYLNRLLCKTYYSIKRRK